MFAHTAQDVMSKGHTCLLDVDVNGVLSFKRSTLTPRYLFISPPGSAPLEVLEARLRGRGTETEETLSRRLKQAEVELQYRDQPGFFDKVIVNDDLNKAYVEFKEFCLKDE